MATEAQIAANQANAQLSSGPKSEAGRAASSKNHLSHGLTYRGGMFILLPWESAEEFDHLVIDLKSEYSPRNRTELILVERMAQHHWLRNRATMLQGNCFLDDGTIDDQRLALYLRYETTHERAFHKCLNELLRIRAEKRKQEIGFESQNEQTGGARPQTRAASDEKRHPSMGRHAGRSQGVPPANANRAAGTAGRTKSKAKG
jgi:hypothetical protein